MPETKGVVYLAIGRTAYEMALTSALSMIIRSINQSIEITMLTDIAAAKPEIFSNIHGCIKVVNISADIETVSHLDGGRKVAYLKTRLHKLSPYHKTLYLDNDTKAVRDISGIWDLVEDGIGFSKAFNPLVEGCEYHQGSEEYYTATRIDTWYQYNSGVFLFTKSSSMSIFFENWCQKWSKFKNHENMALTRLLDYPQVNLIELPCRFNDFHPNRNDESCIVHYISWYKKYLND